MNTYNTVLRNRGFISVAALLIMMASLSVVMAIVYRSAQGGVITRNLKQSNQAYQEGDKTIEQFLQTIQKIDSNPATSIKIPDSISAKNLCDSGGVTCYANGLSATGSTVSVEITDSTPKINDIMQVSASADVANVARSLQVPVPDRVPMPIIEHQLAGDPNLSSGLLLENVTNGIRISWKALEKYSGATDSNVINRDQYDKLEVRRTEVLSTTDPADYALLEALLKDGSKDWKSVGSVDAQSVTDASDMPDATFIDDTDVASGTAYAYIIKATNKNPLKLDSYYSIPALISTP